MVEDTRVRMLVEEYKGMLTNIRSEKLREVIAYGIVVANQLIDWRKVRERYGIRERRSLLLKIISEDGEEEAGFILTEDGRAIPYTGIERVTVEVIVPEPVFWLLLSGKIGLREAWLRDLIRLEGENPLRDAMILIPLFERLRELVLG